MQLKGQFDTKPSLIGSLVAISNFLVSRKWDFPFDPIAHYTCKSAAATEPQGPAPCALWPGTVSSAQPCTRPGTLSWPSTTLWDPRRAMQDHLPTVRDPNHDRWVHLEHVRQWSWRIFVGQDQSGSGPHGTAHKYNESSDCSLLKQDLKTRLLD